MINWENIKEKMHSLTKTSLKNGTPSISDEMILEGIFLLKKVILHNINSPVFSGLSKILIPALQDSLVLKIGDIGSLRIIADSIEPLLKKICVIGKGLPIASVENLTLIPVLKLLGINSALTMQSRRGDFPDLSETNLESFKTENEFLYEICNAYLIRNKVHVSPDLSDLEILTYLRDLLVVYLYAVLQFKEQINSLPISQIQSSISDQVLNGDENKMLFDFISFGNTTTEIKTQIIEAFILHYLIDKDFENISNLIKSADEYLKTGLSEPFYRRKIENLRQSSKVEYVDIQKNTIRLTVNEKSRLCKVQGAFKDNKELFLLYYKEIIDNYGFESHFDPILEKLTDFFVSNFNIDVKEVYKSDISETEDRILVDFLKYLQGITNDEEIAKNLLIELLKLCEQSDFVVRISASKVIGKLTNPEYFQNYIRSQRRIVYIDTQLVLYALCTGYVRKSKYENIYYLIIEELIEYAKEHPNLELRFSRLYLSEISYQLKLALLLIPFEDVTSPDLSTNVFYQFYDHLKQNDLLKENDESLAAFLENWLIVSEDDALNREWDEIISSNISNLLQEELQIKVISLPYYSNRDSAISVLEETIKQNSLSPKSFHLLSNDALMVCHLSNLEEHETEPFFLTWDKTFTYYRREFKAKFKRMEIISWHLFNPSKFLNHMSLIDFKIDPKSITNEYLSIMESMGLHEKTRTIFDNMNRFLDIKNISKTQRRKYIELTKGIFNEKEFSYEINLPEVEIKAKISKPFETILDGINSYYHDSTTKYSIDFYRNMLLNEDYFLKVVEIIKNEIVLDIKGEKKDDYKVSINALLEEYEKNIKEQRNSQ